MSFKERTFRCTQCERKAKAILWHYDPAPICAEHGHMVETGGGPVNTVMIATDDIPGGMEVPHVLCSDDGLTPGIVYSKSELKRRLAQEGWTMHGDTPNVLPEHKERAAREREERFARMRS